MAAKKGGPLPGSAVVAQVELVCSPRPSGLLLLFWQRPQMRNSRHTQWDGPHPNPCLGRSVQVGSEVPLRCPCALLPPHERCDVPTADGALSWVLVCFTSAPVQATMHWYQINSGWVAHRKRQGLPSHPRPGTVRAETKASTNPGRGYAGSASNSIMAFRPLIIGMQV